MSTKEGSLGIVAFVLLGVMAGLLVELVYSESYAGRVRALLGTGDAGAVLGGLLAAAAGWGAVCSEVQRRRVSLRHRGPTAGNRLHATRHSGKWRPD
jgi:hypothetical protein